MELGLLPKLRFARAAEAVEGLRLTDEAKPFLRAGSTPAAFLAALVAEGLWSDAVRVMAMALPRREAVWWACLSAREALSDKSPPGEEAAIKAAEAWVFEPSEEKRRACFAPGKALEFATPGAYAALAAFWSGGSLAPPDAPVVIPPGDALTGTAASAAVLLAASRAAGEIDKTYERAIAQAVDIANGGNGRRG